MRGTERRPVELSVGAGFHGRYEIGRPIKEGGVGAVYEVLDHDTRRHRALEVMLPALAADADRRGRFKQEAVITAVIESEHTVETFDADVDPETGSPSPQQACRSATPASPPRSRSPVRPLGGLG